MNFKIITTFKDAIRKVPADLNQLNDKARRHWLKNGDETISHGMRFAQQAEKYLPNNATLRVYYEGENLPESTSKVEFVPHVYEAVEKFKSISKDRYIKKKQSYYTWDEEKKINRKNYDYEFEAVRFCHPPLSLIDCYGKIKERYLVSIDADVFIHRDIPEDFFPSLVTEPACTYFLNRAPHKHMESGFIIWDSQDPFYRRWFSLYRGMYEGGKIYNLYDGWTDCHAFDKVNNDLIKEGMKTVHIASHQANNVWEVSPLQKYISHYKGSAI